VQGPYVNLLLSLIMRVMYKVRVAVVGISSWRLRWRNPGTSSGVMWIDLGRLFDASNLYDVIKVILIVGRVYVKKCWQSSTFDHHDFASVIFCEWVSHISVATVIRSYVRYVLKSKKQLSTDHAGRLNMLLVCVYLMTLRHMTVT
jgi:hypothetical protein